MIKYLAQLVLSGLPPKWFKEMLFSEWADIHPDLYMADVDKNIDVALSQLKTALPIWGQFESYFKDTLTLNVRSNKFVLDGEIVGLEDLRYGFVEQFALDVSFDKFTRELSGWVVEHHQADPFMDFLNGLSVVPVDAANTVLDNLHKVMGTQSAIEKLMVRKWLLAAVERTVTPGKQGSLCLVLKGKGGAGKSSFFAGLGSVVEEGHYAVSALSTSGFSTDQKMACHNSLLIELEELDNVTDKTGMDGIKSFLSGNADSFRRPYARESKAEPRRFVVGATCNESQPLIDDGAENRRYMVVEVPGTNEEGLIRSSYYHEHAIAIWQAVWSLYQSGELAAFSPEQRKLLKDARTDEVARSRVYYRMMEGLPKLTKAAYGSQEAPKADSYGLHIDDFKALFVDDPSRVQRKVLADIKQALADCGYVQHRVQKNGSRLRPWAPSWFPKTDIEGLCNNKTLWHWAEQLEDELGRSGKEAMMIHQS